MKPFERQKCMNCGHDEFYFDVDTSTRVADEYWTDTMTFTCKNCGTKISVKSSYFNDDKCRIHFHDIGGYPPKTNTVLMIFDNIKGYKGQYYVCGSAAGLDTTVFRFVPDNDELKEAYEKLERRVKRLDKYAETLRNEKEQLENKLKLKDNEIEELKHLKSLLDGENANLHKSCERLKKENAELDRRLGLYFEDENQNIVDLESENERLEQKIKFLNETIISWKNKYQALSDKNVLLQKQLDVIKSTFKEDK